MVQIIRLFILKPAENALVANPFRFAIIHFATKMLLLLGCWRRKDGGPKGGHNIENNQMKPKGAGERTAIADLGHTDTETRCPWRANGWLARSLSSQRGVAQLSSSFCWSKVLLMWLLGPERTPIKGSPS